MDSKRSIRAGDHYYSIVWKDVTCELCKTKIDYKNDIGNYYIINTSI